MKKKANGLRRYKKSGYTLMESVIYLAITSIILVLISNFVLSSLRVLDIMDKKLKNDLYIYEGMTYVDKIIDQRRPNKINKISENEIIFINEFDEEKNFKLIYSKPNKALRIKFNVMEGTNNNLIRESIEDLEFKVKGNVLYIKIITTTGEEMEKSCAVKGT